jgi:hypothetical protein
VASAGSGSGIVHSAWGVCGDEAQPVWDHVDTAAVAFDMRDRDAQPLRQRSVGDARELDMVTIELGPLLPGLAFESGDAAARGCDGAGRRSEPRDDPHDRDDACRDPEVALVDGGLQDQENSAGGTGCGWPPEKPCEGPMLLSSVVILSHAAQGPIALGDTGVRSPWRKGSRRAQLAGCGVLMTR